jgi:hypothetical protein
MSIYTKGANKEHGPVIYVVALILAGIVFIILLPYGIVVVGSHWDQRLGLPDLDVGR